MLDRFLLIIIEKYFSEILVKIFTIALKKYLQDFYTLVQSMTCEKKESHIKVRK